MFRQYNRIGFTLVELLVVIGIIALLIGILLPVLNKARQASQLVACASNMHQLGLGFSMYCDQNKGLVPQKGPDGSGDPGNSFSPPPAGPSAATGAVVGVDDSSIWFNGILKALGRKTYYDMLVDDQHGIAAPTYGQNSVFICPSAGAISARPDATTLDRLSADGNYFLLYGTDSQGIFTGTPAGSFKFNMSYVINASTTNVIGSTQSFSTINQSHLRPASAVVIIMEKLVTSGECLDASVQKYVAANSTYYAGVIDTKGFRQNVSQPKANWKRFTTRHNSGGNLLFADGHVDYFKWTDTQFSPSQLPITATSNANQPGKIVWSVAGPIQ